MLIATPMFNDVARGDVSPKRTPSQLNIWVMK